MHPAAVCSILLALHLQSGAQVTEHAAYDDRIDWVLPADRLAMFARSGVVIDEDKKTSIVAIATVAQTPRDMMTLSGTWAKTVVDVPRHRTEHERKRTRATITPRNNPLPARPVDVEEAAMADLPAKPLCVGGTWRTRVTVVTSLGSGMASIEHTVVAVSGRWIEIDVKGAGVIYGMEYNLPRLLPGSIGLSGKAWFDPVTGSVAQESYVLHNKLLRTSNGKSIGFLETETVDVTTRVAALRAPARPDPHRSP